MSSVHYFLRCQWQRRPLARRSGKQARRWHRSRTTKRGRRHIIPPLISPFALLTPNVPRLSKRARAPPTIYEAPDPEMAQILKTIKKQEEEEGKRTSTSDKEEEKEEVKEEKKLKEKPKEKAKEKAKNKPKLLPKRKEQKKSIVEDSDSDLDEPPSPKPTPKSRVKKPVAKAKVAPVNKKGDPVFFK